MKDYKNKILTGCSYEVLQSLPDNIVDSCVTSPPYYGLRDYGVAKSTWPKFTYTIFGMKIKVPAMKCCLGLEKTPEQFIGHLVLIFNEVRRVLKPTGTLWLNLGDSYCGSGTGSGNQESSNLQGGKKTQIAASKRPSKANLPGIKQKDLIGIPWMAAFALRDSGWYLRQDIIWNKPNPMPESVTDRCTKSHEYIFLFSKSNKYYYDAEAIKTPVKDSTIQRMMQQIEFQKGSDRIPGKTNGNMKAVGPGRLPRKGVDVKGGNQSSIKGIPAMAINGSGVTGHSGYFDASGKLMGGGFANRKSVWTVSTTPFKDAHYAVYPQQLVQPCIQAGSPKGGLILDPFLGSGTTAIVACKENCFYLGIELSPENVTMAQKRIYKEIGMFL